MRRRRELLLMQLLLLLLRKVLVGVALLLKMLSTLLSANLRLVMQTEGNAVDSSVECAHDGHGGPKVTDLEETVEDAVFHVLHVALVTRHRPVPDEVLPPYD